jgi:inosine-uridine nucleoside N-ribohydrolase
MRTSLASAAAVLLAWATSASAQEQPAAPSAKPAPPAPPSAALHRTPAILDTDIGDDIDDTWALALLLRSPELDLRLVTTDYGKPAYRGRLVARLLETAHRTDVAIGLGPEVEGVRGEGGQAAWVKDYELAKFPGKVHSDGAQAIVDVAMAAREPVTLICIGPLPTVARALEREPRIAEHLRFVGMYGSVHKGYEGKASPDAEWNVKAAPAACRRAFAAGWPVAITPLDTCGLVQLEGEQYRALCAAADPLTRAVLENYRIWCGAEAQRAERASTVLFDTVAVYLATSPDRAFVRMADVRLAVRDDGMTVVDPAQKPIACALEWRDLAGYREFLVKRLTGK